LYIFFVMIAFSIGPIDIYWYGIFYLLWFLLWYGFLLLIWKSWIFKKYKKLQELLCKHTDDILIAIILWVLLWGRLWEVFIYQWQYFSHNLLQIFAVWNGGMSFIGGIIWVWISLYILKRIKKLSYSEFWLLIDCIVSIVPIAIFFWRFWNYLNQELYWLLVPDNFWWLGSWVVNILTNLNIFHIYTSVDNSLRVNTNFLSMIFEWFVLFLITGWAMFCRVRCMMKTKISNMKKTIKPWFIVWLFLVFYSLFRFFLEYLRVDSQSQYIGLFTRSQIVFVLFVIIGLWFLFRRKN
jgi:phosphatidylglycerol:prolipoprotein diacylglycerol transferase